MFVCLKVPTTTCIYLLKVILNSFWGLKVGIKYQIYNNHHLAFYFLSSFPIHHIIETFLLLKEKQAINIEKWRA